MKPNFSSLIFTALVFGQTFCLANVREILEEPYPKDMDDATAMVSLQVDKSNPLSPKAWVEVTFRLAQGPYADPENYVMVPRYIEGLSYDPSKKEMVYQTMKGERIVCARMKDSKFLLFNYAVLQETGNCAVDIKKQMTSEVSTAPSEGEVMSVPYKPMAEIEFSTQ